MWSIPEPFWKDTSEQLKKPHSWIQKGCYILMFSIKVGHQTKKWLVSYLSTSWGSWVEDSCLHFAGQSGIDRQDDQLRHIRTQRFHPLIENLTGCVDLLLTSQEHQNVPYTE